MATSTSFRLRAPKTLPSKSEIRLGAPTRNVSSSVGVARLRRTREKCFILYRAKTAYRWSRHTIGQDLNDSNKLQQIIDPIMVSKVTKNGTQDTLGTQKWYKLWPKMVNLGYGWPIMVSKGPVSLTFHGHFPSLRSFQRPKMVVLEPKNGHVWVYMTKNGRFRTQKWYTNGAKYNQIQSKTDSLCTKVYTIFGANLTKFISNYNKNLSHFCTKNHTNFSKKLTHFWVKNDSKVYQILVKKYVIFVPKIIQILVRN